MSSNDPPAISQIMVPKWAVIAAVGLALGCSSVSGTDGAGGDTGDSTAEVHSALSTTYPDGFDYCGDGTLGTVNGNLYHKSAGKYVFLQSCGGGCAVNQSGVSDACVALGPWPSDALLNIARAKVGSASIPSVITASPTASWSTDAAGGTGQDIIDATQYFATWRKSNPTASVPQSVKNAMAARIDALACGSSTSPTAMSSADRASIVARIIAVYAGTVPSTPQGALDLIGARAQCKETVDRWVRDAKLTSQNYSTYLANGWLKKYSDIRPGNIAIWKNSAHIAVVIAVTRDATGVLQSITVSESNWASGFSCPGGALPWARVIGTHTVLRSDINVGSSGAWKIVEIKS